VNPSDLNIRAAFSEIFGAGTSTTQLAAAAKRLVTKGEKLFATGTGSEVSPGLLTFEGNISPQDVYEAMING